MKYQAFISYKHSNYGRQQAEALERALKRYAKPLLKPPIKIFRDEKHLVPGEGLSKLIRDGLDNSEYLLFLAESESAQSRWCQDELEYWCKTLKRADKLIIIHIADRIALDQENDLVDWEKTNALPAILKPHIKSIPFYVDLNWVETEQDSDLGNIRYKSIINGITAKFRGLTPEQINDQEIRVFRRNRRLRNGAISGLSILLIISIFSSILAFFQAGIAKKRLNVSEIQRYVSLSQKSSGELKGTDAVRYAKMALARCNKELEYLVTPAIYELSKLSLDNKLVLLTGKVKLNDEVLSFDLAPNKEKILTVSKKGQVGLWDFKGNLLNELRAAPSDIESAFFSPIGNLIVANSNDTIFLWDTKGKMLTGFTGVTSARFSPDGKQILTCGGLGCSIWDGRKGISGFGFDIGSTTFINLDNHDSPVVNADFSADGKYILTSSNYTTKIWNSDANLLAQINCSTPNSIGNTKVFGTKNKIFKSWNYKGELLASFIGHQDVINSIAFSPGGKKILSSSNDKTAKLWDQQGNLLAELVHPDEVQKAIFSPDGSRILTTGSFETRLWDSEGNFLNIRSKYEETIQNAFFSPRGHYFITQFTDGTVEISDLEGNLLNNLEEILNMTSLYDNYSLALKFTPDERYFVTAKPEKNEIEIRKIINGKLNVIEGYNYQSGKTAIISPDGTKILMGSTNNSAKLFDFEGKLLAEYNELIGTLRRIVFTPDGQHVITLIEDSKLNSQIKVWDFSGAPVRSLELRSKILSIDFPTNKEKEQVLVSAADSTTMLWDLKGNLLTKYEHDQGVRKAIFSPMADKVLITSTGSAQLWDLEGNLLTSYKFNGLGNASFSPDQSRILISASTDTISRLWDLQGKLLSEHKNNFNAHSSLFSPRDNLFTTVLDTTVSFWNMEGRLINSFSVKGIIDKIVFSPSGKYLLITSTDWENMRDISKHLSLWDMDEQLLHEINLGRRAWAVFSFGFSPDENVIFVCSKDRSVKLFDIKGNLQSILNKHRGYASESGFILDPLFSQDEKKVLTGSSDGLANIWQVHDANWLRSLEVIPFSQEETEQYTNGYKK